MTIANDYENLGPLPENWESVALKEIVSKLVDGSHNPPSKKDSGFPMLSARNIENNHIVFDKFRFISEDDYEKEHARTRIEPGDVLLTIVGTIGRSAVVPAGLKDFTLQRSVAVLTPHEILPKYLMYQLQSPYIQGHFIKNARGTAQKGVYLKTLGQTPIRVAPPEQQKRIVAEIEKQFSRLDEAVANLKRVKANLKRYKAAVLKAAVEGKLSDCKDVTDSFGQWDMKPIDVAIESLSQGWSPRCEREPSDAPDIWGVIKTTAVQSMHFLEVENKKLPDKLEPRLNLELAVDDLLITRAGPRKRVGVACLVKATRPRLILCDKVYRIKCKVDVVVPAFLELVLNAPHIADMINELKTGISDSGVNLTQKRFKELIIPLPPLPLQTCIIDEVNTRLSINEELESQIEVNIQRAERLRQSILGKAFSGQLIEPKVLGEA